MVSSGAGSTAFMQWGGHAERGRSQGLPQALPECGPDLCYWAGSADGEKGPQYPKLDSRIHLILNLDVGVVERLWPMAEAGPVGDYLGPGSWLGPLHYLVGEPPDPRAWAGTGLSGQEVGATMSLPWGLEVLGIRSQAGR